MALYGRRKLIEQTAKDEAAGYSFWTTHFDPRARTRILVLIESLGTGPIELMPYEIFNLMRKELGVSVSQTMRGLIMDHDDDLMPSVIEATLIAARRMAVTKVVDSLASDINEVMNEHRISYELVNSQMVEFQSKELHQELVQPALRLLSGRPGWDKVEVAYQDALREISIGSPANAITDAGTALQEALVALGCQGNALGPLIVSARNQGLLATHDSKLTGGIEKIATWVSADRSTTGDSHKASTGATRDDAWFTVHVVGALILRLAHGPRTTQP